MLIDKKFQSTAAVIFLVPHTTETKISSNMIHRKISKALFLFFALLLLVVVVVVLMRRGMLWEERGERRGGDVADKHRENEFWYPLSVVT